MPGSKLVPANDMVDEPLTMGMFDEPEQERQERASITAIAFGAPPSMPTFNTSTFAVQPPQQTHSSDGKPMPSPEEAALMEAFAAKFANAKLPGRNGESSRSHKMTTQDMLSTFEAEVKCAPAVASSSSPSAPAAVHSSSRTSSFNGLTEEDLQDLPLSPPPEPEGADYDNVSDDEDWDKISTSDALFPDDNTSVGGSIPSVVYQPPTFSGAWAELTERYSLSPEQRRNLAGAVAMLKCAGEFGYAVVSEPVMDAAEWIVQKQFGCRMEDLPEELRLRLLASLPGNVQNALRVANNMAGRSAGAAATSYRMLSAAREQLTRRVRSTTESAGEVDAEEGAVQTPAIDRDLGDVEDDMELIDELEGMTIGSA